jgi:hypothetical protein
VVAYLRAVCLARFLLLMEWGRELDVRGAAALADLVAAALVAREDDPLAPAARPSPEFRSVAAADPLLDEGLEGALRAKGFEVSHAQDGRAMFWVARPDALAARFDERRRPGQSDADLLCRILPPGRFGFWQADRF